ncbi:MAG: hypothetical protein ABEL97_14300 [Salinibacter sp.]
MLFRVSCGLAASLLLLLPAAAQSGGPLTGFAPETAERQRSCEAQLLDEPTPEAFRAHLAELTDEPHPAGTPANDRVRAYIDSVMTAAGLSTTEYPYDLYMPSPSSAAETEVALVTPIRQPLNRQE